MSFLKHLFQSTGLFPFKYGSCISNIWLLQTQRKKKKVNLKFWGAEGAYIIFIAETKYCMSWPQHYQWESPSRSLNNSWTSVEVLSPGNFSKPVPFMCAASDSGRVSEQIEVLFRQPLLVLKYPGSACSLNVSWGTYCSRWKWRGKIVSAAEEWWFIWT